VQWQEHATLLCAIAAMSQRVQHSRKQRLLRTAFATWLERKCRLRSHREAAIVRHRQKQAGATRHAFDSWLNAVASKRYKRALVQRGQRKVQIVLLSSVLVQWSSCAASRCRNKRVLVRLRERARQRRMQQAWQLWRRSAAARSCAVARLVTIGAQLAAQAQAAAFRAWAGRCVKQRRSRDLAHASAKAQLRRMLHLWARHTIMLCKRRQAYHLLVHRHATKALAQALRAWRDYVAQRWTLRRVVHARLQNAFDSLVAVRTAWLAGAAFDGWLHLARVRRDAAAAEQHEQRAQLRERQAGAWHAWRSAASASRRRCQRLQRLMARATSSTMRHAWHQWLGHISDERMRRTLEFRANSFMLQSTLRGSFDRWVESAVRTRAKRQRVAAARQRLTRVRCLRTLYAWHGVLQFSRRRNRVLARAVHRRLQRLMLAVLLGWQGAAQQEANERSATCQHAVEWQRQILTAWSQLAQRKAQLVCQARGVLMRRRQHMALRASLSGWADAVALRGRARILIEQFAGRQQRRLLHRAWRAWAQEAAQARQRLALVHQRRAQQRHRALFISFLACITGCVLSSSASFRVACQLPWIQAGLCCTAP
jgi:hypothetical protein